MSEPHEHLEHAEHAQHHGSDPLNQRVAVSMAIVAACLAGISMVGHRTHNEVLQLQGDSNQLRTAAATYEVEKSNLYAWYQAKKLRQAQYEISASLAGLMAAAGAERDKLTKDWKAKAEKYNQPDEKDNLPELDARGAEAAKKAEALIARAKEVRAEADHVHKQADRIDIGHLLAEVSLVLCSITLLTKKRLFWQVGLTAAVVAVALTLSAYAIPVGPPHESHAHARADTGPGEWRGV